MKNSDCEFRIKNKNQICPNDEEIIKLLVLNWYDATKDRKETKIRSLKMTGISIKMIGEENYQIKISEKFEDNLPLPDNFDYSSLNEDDENEKDNELFKSLKYFASTQPTISFYFKKVEEEFMNLED